MLNDRNIVLTGGSRGFGKELAGSLARKGGKVFVFSRRSVPKEHSNIVNIQCDVSNDTELKRMQNVVRDEIGKVHIWINNAAMTGGFKKFEEMSYCDVHNTIKTNLVATVLSTKFALEVMKAQDDGGHIFNLSGAGGDHSKTPMFSVYGSTKSAIVHFSKTVQEEIKGGKVKLHILSPGLMNTDLLMNGLDEHTENIMKIFAEKPCVVAEHICGQILMISKNEQNNQAFIRYFNVQNIISRAIRSHNLKFW